MKPICRYEFDAADIVSKYPAQIENTNKEIVFGIASPPDAVHSGKITFTRWRQMPLPDTISRERDHPTLEMREAFFAYEAPPEGQTDWYLNFAHRDLFSFYGGALFAQDEMQVAEHPALASLRQALIASDVKPVCVEGGVPTPALITGVERRCAITTDPNPDEGRPEGLYGNSFSRGTGEAVRKATRPIDPPTKSNILAIEAPAYGAGRYKLKEIEFVLSTAITGFSAAVHESGAGAGAGAGAGVGAKADTDTPARVAIHTGFWGCGAYGGNRVLMPLLQMIAAAISGVDLLVFHSGPDSSAYIQAKGMLGALLPAGQPVKWHDVISRIEGMNFEWGVSDGN